MESTPTPQDPGPNVYTATIYVNVDDHIVAREGAAVDPPWLKINSSDVIGHVGVQRGLDGLTVTIDRIGQNKKIYFLVYDNYQWWMSDDVRTPPGVRTSLRLTSLDRKETSTMKLSGASTALVVILLVPFVIAQDTSVKNTSSPIGNGRWSWTVFLDGPSPTLDKIKCVEYHLHPTFPNPLQVVCERGKQQAFALNGNGWGEFNVAVYVKFLDGSERSYNHWLSLTGTKAKYRRRPCLRSGVCTRHKGLRSNADSVPGPCLLSEGAC